ncbi:MAG: tyrosinase family protein [Bradyrhizobium sp.]|uniref:tyrosinase family protein n=1 Tax=Bradyrhizobium sp. TaxID=376 RepID=UPI001C28589E|nr:tyrosinase family protein [Bradyrhizobium sp.]MBU6464146.1 tyrosinase family protein [Pseudomonadota bacterium]MDE2068480.1 tyrosinase family protein [Bradyrhizobium sp.]MDE2242209.1 tyrosinase family protein [Bradyrhizobium sp.]MDE2469221.1 tyrosinase family protein [Bradyrhizobium sp.]
MRLPLLFGTTLLSAVGLGHASAQSPQFVPAYPLYCQGPLTTGSPSGRETTTPFIWAPSGAGAAAPGPGQCAWADRAARGIEIQSAGGNVICDFSGAMHSVPAGTFVEVGVARDPQVNNCMHLARYDGTVKPPFSAIPALPPFVRQSIASLTPTQIASLRHGIQVMMSRPATDPTSFRFQANIHGTYDAMTTPQEMQSWNNCEHGSYYFASWHRMFLYFFDRILRAASGDPNLVLPYWNWTDPAQRTLPLAFRQPADASNPLYIAPPGRPAALDAGTASLGAGTVDYSAAFASTAFDSPGGSGASFGGQIATPMQFNGPHGDLESQPHDVVHVALGGLMSDPDTAAQDPIFWLHHANIDRMWNRWLAQGGGRSDATDTAWLNTRFTFYDEAGHAVYLTGAEVEHTVGQLNYRYDDDPLTLHRVPFPIATRDFIEARPVAAATEAPAAEAAPALAESAASAQARPIELAGTTTRVQVPLTEEASSRMRALVANNAPRQVFLRLDAIQYDKSNGVYYEVYVNPPAGEKLDVHAPGYVGNLSLFGLKPHAMEGHAQPAAKDIYVEYDISHLVNQAMAVNSKELTVVLVPRGLFDAQGEPLPVPEKAQGTVGRVVIMSRR